MADHYEVLGVERDATTEEIKRAYRRLARELHPDVNPSSDAADRFKDVTHAYDVLSDPQQRQRYDLGDSGGASGGFGGFGDLFESFFAGGMQSRGPRSRSERGQDALLRVEMTLDEVMFGAHRDIAVDTAVRCEDCDASCCAPGTRPITCTICGGAGSVQRTMRSLLGNVVTSSPCGGCRGYGTVIPNPCPACGGSGRVRAHRTVSTDIPAGVDTGIRIQMPGSGEAGPAGGPNGDLYLEIHVAPHATYRRDGDDLQAVLTVNVADAMLGTTVHLAALDGDLELTVRPGVQPGDVLTIRGRGVTQLRGSGRGDLHVAVQVAIPTKLSGAERKLVEQLAQSRGNHPPQFVQHQSGLFARLRDRFTG